MQTNQQILPKHIDAQTKLRRGSEAAAESEDAGSANLVVVGVEPRRAWWTVRWGTWGAPDGEGVVEDAGEEELGMDLVEELRRIVDPI